VIATSALRITSAVNASTFAEVPVRVIVMSFDHQD